jgi:hypothetical protein
MSEAEAKDFFNKEGELTSTVSFEEANILLTTVVGGPDEKSSSDYSQYVAAFLKVARRKE